MSLPSSLLRLSILLLAPVWLSLTAEELGLRMTLPSLMADLRRPAPDALAGWREEEYLKANPDVAAAVRGGQMPSGYVHYLRFGQFEGRRGGLPAPRPQPGFPPGSQAVAVAPPPAQAPALAPPVQPPATPPALPPATPPRQTAVKPPPQTATQAVSQAAPQAARQATAPPKPAAPPEATKQPLPQQVSGVRTANRDTGIRVVLDVSRQPQFQPAIRRPDGSLAVRLPATTWTAAPSGPLFPSALTYQAERKGADVQLVLAVPGGKGALRLSGSSTLPPDKERGHRLVLDLILLPAGKPASGNR